ncbi:IucA/IucC family protein [Nonomuraea sp. ZG12]|uniref:IucA/IucC family protein n=1 Tax=Nonomuraea sp. ZG12 TaxID=3452207 RepID=UPI003F8965C5
MRSREAYLAARVLNALLREDYGRLSSRVGRSRSGVGLTLADGRLVRLAPGAPFQDFVVAPGQQLGLEQVLETLTELADPQDAAGVAAFFEECVAALAALELHDAHLPDVLARKPSYESLAAFADHPVYPTSRARPGLSEADLLAYAPEFAPAFELRWAAVPRRMLEPGSAPALPADVRARELPDGEVLFPVHPLTVDEVRGIDGVRLLEEPRVTVRPTLSMRTVELDARTHLKLPLPTSTLGLRNRRSIKAGTLRDGARAELLLRGLADSDVLIADEQTYAHAGHEYLAWMVRRLPAGKVVPVAALAIPGVLAELGDVLPAYLRLLLRWNVRLFVEYGVALEAHQQNLSLVFTGEGMKLLVKDNDGLLASPARLAAAGVEVPEFADARMLTEDPHALADVFVTITLHLACAAIAFGALPHARASALLRDTLAEALDGYGDDPMARLLRARTLDAARLTGKSMVTAGTLVAKERTGAADVNKFYGTSGPNYLRRA